MDLIKQGLDIAKDPYHTRWICPLLLLADAALCGLVVWKIPYTEIDWKAYMQQIAQYNAGERDYVKIYGNTGPLVYPAAHVHVYRLLYAVTDRGQDIRLAQYIFTVLYITSLALVMLCYRLAKAPPYVFPLLILSKRLHSIFLLRLFNDGVAVLFLFLAIYCYQRRQWTIGSLAYSFGLGVKMSLLLVLPAVGVVLWQGMGRNRAITAALLMLQLQMVLALPFISVYPTSYLSRAFELTRQFLFKWTVNWRFVGEAAFLSPTFSRALLAAHAALLGLVLSTRWLHQPIAEAMRQLFDPPSEAAQAKIARRVTPDYILTTVLSAMVIGCLCARSLHYQFYAYIAWSTPFLLWRSGVHPVLVYAIWAAQEWAWNVYPSSNVSSGIVVACLALTSFSAWLGTDTPKVLSAADREKQK